jgi:flagellar biosynthesis GTPase FlhF
MTTRVSTIELAALRANYDFMMRSPLVQKLKKNITKYEREVAILNRVILHLGSNLPATTIDVKPAQVAIKPEFVDLSDACDDTPHIIYELVEDDNTNSIEDDEEASSSAEEEEEEEEEEEAASAADDEAASAADDEEEEASAADEEEEDASAEEEEASAEEEEASAEEEEASAEEEEASAEEDASAEEEEMEEEEEVFEVTIKGKTYYTSDAQRGEIYAIDKNGDPGNRVGEFKNGKAVFA